MYSTKILEKQSDKIRTEKILSEVLKIKSDLHELDKEYYNNTNERLTNEMIKKVRKALK